MPSKGNWHLSANTSYPVGAVAGAIVSVLHLAPKMEIICRRLLIADMAVGLKVAWGVAAR
jgi:hypothetical protein